MNIKYYPCAQKKLDAPKKKILATMIAATMASGITPAIAEESAALEEIIVTSRKKSENLQDVAVTVQALDSRALNDLNIGNYDDYIRYQPNVTTAGLGPGQSSIFIRGLATDEVGVGLAEVVGPAPNVALYLDEHPVSAISRNLDVYVTDMERIEVLAGPQGTLYGASSQAGTVRLITNKPDSSAFDAGFETSFASTKDGDLSSGAEGFLNIPIIEEKLAVRAVIYNISRGGYIDNVESTIALSPMNPNFPAGAQLATTSNTHLVEEDFNDSSYQGGRLGVSYAINDDWDILIQHLTQKLETDGVFNHDPDQYGDLNVSQFYPDTMDDEVNQTAWTLTGRLGALEAIYTGAYLERDVEQSIDYTSYIQVGPYVPYYICNYPAYTVCNDATYGSKYTTEQTRESHEIRISTPTDKRLSAVGGVYYGDVEVGGDARFIQPGSISEGFPLQQPISTSTQFNSSPREIGTTFVNDVTRTQEQWAVFGEVTYEIIPDLLRVTAGARYYDMELTQGGSTNFAARGATDIDFGVDIDAVLAGESPASEDDVIFKANITWTPTNDLLFYGTYSEGFRPGGFNRNGGTINPANGRAVPFTYESDNIKNYEFGWKMTFFDNRLRFNGAAYFVDWTEMQLSVTDFDISNLTFTTNVGEAEVYGTEGDIAFAATEQLTLYASYSYNHAELTEVPPNIINIAPEGSELAFTPEFQFNARARYEWELGDFSAHAQLAVVHADDSFNSIIVGLSPDRRQDLDSWTTLDGSIGIRDENWSVTLFGENLSDKRATRFIKADDFDLRETINRPRTIGLRIKYDY